MQTNLIEVLTNETLNGNLKVSQGTYKINNDISTTKLNLTINGDVTVESTGAIETGKGATNTTTNPVGITGGVAAPFLLLWIPLSSGGGCH